MLFGERHNAAEGRQLCSGFRRSVAILQATNPGEFDAAAYYRRKDCLFALRKTKITAQTKNYGRLEEFLSQLRYESEVLFRKLLGEKNGATASAMVLGRKKEWTAK